MRQNKYKYGKKLILHCAIFPKHQLDLPPIFDIKKRDTTKGKICIVNGNRICRHVTEPFFSIKFHNGYYTILYCTAHYYCDHNNFLWEPHMQISDMSFYWLSSSIVNRVLVSIAASLNRIRFQSYHFIF